MEFKLIAKSCNQAFNSRARKLWILINLHQPWNLRIESMLFIEKTWNTIAPLLWCSLSPCLWQISCQSNFWNSVTFNRLTIWVWNSRNNIFAVGNNYSIIRVVVVMPVMVVVMPSRHFCGKWCSTIFFSVELMKVSVVQGVAVKQIPFKLESFKVTKQLCLFGAFKRLFLDNVDFSRRFFNFCKLKYSTHLRLIHFNLTGKKNGIYPTLTLGTNGSPACTARR